MILKSMLKNCVNFDLKISKNVLEIENYVKKRTSPATEVKPVVKHGGSGDVPSSSNKGVKLPKIVIKNSSEIPLRGDSSKKPLMQPLIKTKRKW